MKDIDSHSLASLTSLWVSSCPLFCHLSETSDPVFLRSKEIVFLLLGTNRIVNTNRHEYAIA